MNIPFLNIPLPSIPIPSTALEYAIYSAVAIIITELLAFILGKLNSTLGFLLKIGIIIFVMYLTWTKLTFFHSLKATAIFFGLYLAVIFFKGVFTSGGSSSSSGSSGSPGRTVTIRYMGKVNGVETYSYDYPGAGNARRTSGYEWVKNDNNTGEVLKGMLGGDVLEFLVRKTEDGSFKIKMSLGDNYLYADTGSIESGKRAVENALEAFKNKGDTDSSSVDIFKQIYNYLGGPRI